MVLESVREMVLADVRPVRKLATSSCPGGIFAPLPGTLPVHLSGSDQIPLWPFHVPVTDWAETRGERSAATAALIAAFDPGFRFDDLDFKFNAQF